MAGPPSTRGGRAPAFSTVDPDEMDAYLTHAYGSRIRLGRQRSTYQLRHSRSAAPAMSLDTVRSTGFSARVPPTGHLMVLLVDTGTITRETEGTRQQFGPGDAFVLARPRAEFSVDWTGAPANVRTLVLDTGLLAAVAGTTVDRVGAMTLGRGRPASAVAQQFQRTLAHVADVALTGPTATWAPPLLVDAAARTMAAITLAAFDNDLVAPTHSADRSDAHPGTVRRAVTYIESTPHLPVDLHDIARAAHVTPRALQLAFRRHLDCTPLEYQRRVRLAAAHDQLTAATPDDGTTVTAVARQWGMDPSRFTAQYRQAYGQLPSHTLRS